MSHPNLSRRRNSRCSPIKAVVYTHNHIDHMAGVQGVLALADRPVCPTQKILAQSLADGGVKVLKGSPEQVQGFFRDYFDPPQAIFQALTLR